MCDQLLPVVVKLVNYPNLDQDVASEALFHRSAKRTSQHLIRQSRIVDFHVEFEQLVLRLAPTPSVLD